MQYDKYTLTKELGAKGVPVGPVLDWNELENDSDLNDDGTIVTIDQQDARGDFKIIGMPFTMSNFTTDYQRAPKLGENNEEILKGLGYSDDQISELLSNGVIGGNDGVKADLKWPLPLVATFSGVESFRFGPFLCFTVDWRLIRRVAFSYRFECSGHSLASDATTI